MSMQENQFDVIILGTGLVESIAAAALSKRGYKVAHIDSNSYYGGDQASLSLEEFVEWADKATTFSSPSSRFRSVSRSSEIPSQSRQYSICLQPAVLPSVGPFISSLISSGVGKYSGFRLVDCVSVFDVSGRVNSVPGSKEDIFKSKEISLIEKRRLMRFLTFTAGDFEDKPELLGKEDMPFIDFLKTVFTLSEKIASVLAYALAFCASSSEPTLPVLHRLRRYLRSAGRYGSSPFLIGHYGCIGDITQGFCRAAAVSGGVYILGRRMNVVSRVEPTARPENSGKIDSMAEKPVFRYNVELDDFPDILECNMLISSPPYIPDALESEVVQLPAPSQKEFSSDAVSIARSIVIIDQALSLQEPVSGPTFAEGEGDATSTESPPTEDAGQAAVDTGILIFPPSSVQGGSTTHSATVLINGEGSLATPKGKWLVYIALPLADDPEDTTPEHLLRPYLKALFSLAIDRSRPITPLFTAFYLEKQRLSFNEQNSENSNKSKTYLIPAVLPFTPLPDFPDVATNTAERTFIEATKVLRTIRKLEDDEEGITFWPPLPRDEEDDVEW